MAVQNFPPNIVQKIQPRVWPLDGSEPGGVSNQVSNWDEVYASDLVSVTNTYFNGIGTDVQSGQSIGFLIEKDHPGAPDSDPTLIDTKHNSALTNVTNPGSSSGVYTFQESFKNIAFQTPGIFQVGKTDTLSLFGARNYADSFINEGAQFDPTTFGDYRLVVYAREGVSDFQTVIREVFELRGLAITNFKVECPIVDVESENPLVRVTGDITVYPNPTDSGGLPAWTPTDDIEYQIRFRNPAIPEAQQVTITKTITPSAPGTDGIVASFDETWDGRLLNGEFCFLNMEIVARARVNVAPDRNTITPAARTNVLLRKCSNKDIMGQLDLAEIINFFGGPLADLSSVLNFSSTDIKNLPASMGYGWTSMENVNCDESGNCRRWLKNGAVYEPILEDNRLSIEVNPSGGDQYYAVRSRDRTVRHFNASGELKEQVDRNGNVTTFTRQTNLYTMTGPKGRAVHYHFDTGELQPRQISTSALRDDPDPTVRKYDLDYFTDGSANQTRLKSITDPVGDTNTFEYDSEGRLVATREIRANQGDRLVTYTYDPDNDVDRLKTVAISSFEPGQTNENEHLLVSYNYEQTFTFPLDGVPTEFVVTEMIVSDLEDPSNPFRVTKMAYDSRGRQTAVFELVDLPIIASITGGGVLGDSEEGTYRGTFYKFEDPNDPYLVTEVKAPNDALTQYQYTARGNLKRVEDDHGNETIINYVEENPAHPAFATFPDLVTSVRRPSPDGTEPVPTYYEPTKLEYDPTNGNLLSVRDANLDGGAVGQLTSFTYNSDGQVATITNRRGFLTIYQYSPTTANLTDVYIEKSSVPSGDPTNPQSRPNEFRRLQLTYDAFDNVETVVDDNNVSAEALYDQMDRVTKMITRPEVGLDVETIFNYEDRVLKSIELPQNFSSSGTRFTNLEYDPLGRVKNVLRDVDDIKQEIRVGFDHDGFGQTRALKRLSSDGYSFKSHEVNYDRLGRSVGSSDFLGRQSTAAYEDYCTGHATTSARGVRKKASFDTLCRLTQIAAGDPHSDPDQPLEVSDIQEVRDFTYDDLGRLISASQRRGYNTTLYGEAIYGVSAYGRTANSPEVRFYEYDSLDRLRKITFEDQKEMQLEYDLEGNLTKITEDASSATPVVTDYTYFGDNRLETVTFRRSSGDKTFTYSYDPGGRLASIQYPLSTGIIAYFDDGVGGAGWDGHGQLKYLRYVKGGNELQRFEYSYDQAGNRRTQKDIPATGASKLWVYEYDYLDRLHKVSLHTHSDPAQLSEASAVTQSIYTYDSADNRLELNLASINELLSFQYNEGDEIVSYSKDTGSGPSLVETFTFDDDGNMVTRTDAASGVLTTYSWTEFNRLESIQSSDSSKDQSHKFWVNGFRRRKTDKNSVETTEYAPGLATAVAKSQASTVTYLMGHHLLGMETGGAMYFNIADALSTTRHLVDVNGNIQASYEFSEHGERIATYENGVSSQKTYVGGLSVQDEVGETELMMMGHRFYEPTGPSGGIGRFLNRDPIGFAGGLNQFEFARSNPVTYTDHTGLSPTTKQGFDAVQAAHQIVWDYAASGGTNLTTLTRLLTQAGYGSIAWFVTQDAGDGTFDAFGPRGMEIINSGDYSFSGLNEGGDAVGVHSTAMRFKRMADAQGGGGLSERCSENSLSRLRAALRGSSLKASQPAISGPIVWDYAARLMRGEIPDPIKVAESIIIEGHHRYAASLLAGIPIPVIEWMAGFYHRSIAFPMADIKIDPEKWEME
jgi:RHS repeat-associated protein